MTVGGVAATPSPSPSPSGDPDADGDREAEAQGQGQGAGKKLRLKQPKLAQPGVKLSYRWYANGKRIKKQKRATLKLSRKLRGKRITAKISVRKAGFETLTLKVGPTKKVKGR